MTDQRDMRDRIIGRLSSERFVKWEVSTVPYEPSAISIIDEDGVPWYLVINPPGTTTTQQ